MLSKEIKETLKHQHYALVGKHSAVQTCRWTKKSLTNDLSTLSSKNLVNKISDIDYTEIKNESFNTIQYTLISVLPVMIILKTIKHLFPLVNPNNSTLEILLESLGQLSLTMFLIVLFGP